MGGMAMIEDGTRLRAPGQILDWQNRPLCSERCASQCSKSKDRIYCSWRVPGAKFDLLNKLDGILCSYKGVVETSKPLFTVHRKVASRNAFNSVNYIVANGNTLVAEDASIPHPA